MTWDEIMQDAHESDGFIAHAKVLSHFKIFRIKNAQDSFILLPKESLGGKPYYIFIWYDDRMRILEKGLNFRKMKMNIRQYIECSTNAKGTKKLRRLVSVDPDKIEPNTQFLITQILIDKYSITN